MTAQSGAELLPPGEATSSATTPRDETGLLPKGQADKLEASLSLNKPLIAPIQVGDVLGEVEVKLGEEVVHKAPLVALTAVEEGGLFGRLWDSIRLFFYGLFD